MHLLISYPAYPLHFLTGAAGQGLRGEGQARGQARVLAVRAGQVQGRDGEGALRVVEPVQRVHRLEAEVHQVGDRDRPTEVRNTFAKAPLPPKGCS